MPEESYLTVGELAKKVGVTVRTIQYYDQEGVLCPSARGPQNQRLYTEEDLSELYRILTLKYLNLSLAEIKSGVDLHNDPNEFRKLIGQQMVDVERSFQHYFKRLTTLGTIMEESLEEGLSIQWERVARVIEDCQEDNKFFWRLTSVNEEEANGATEREIVFRQEMISQWHELIADTLRLVVDGEPIDSTRNTDLAQRYLMLDESQQTTSLDQTFRLMENLAPQGHGQGSFDELRATVIKHLETVVDSHEKRTGENSLSSE